MFSQKPGDVIERSFVNGHAAVNGHPPPIEVHRPVHKADVAPVVAPVAGAAATSRSPFEGVMGDGYVLIGKGTKITGDISNCTLVEVQGVLEGSVTADSVIIRDGGGFKGVLQTDQAEVHGILEGTVVVHELLDIRAHGNVQGDLTYGRIAISEGGFVSGSLQTKSGLAVAEQQTVPSLTLINGMDGQRDEH